MTYLRSLNTIIVTLMILFSTNYTLAANENCGYSNSRILINKEAQATLVADNVITGVTIPSSPYMLVSNSDDEAKRQCGSRCQQQVRGCMDMICKNSNDRPNCHQGCLNRYKECKVSCGYDP